MIDDFNWVMKVIDSCESPWHILAVDKLIDAFIGKYKADAGQLTDELCTYLQLKHASIVAGCAQHT